MDIENVNEIIKNDSYILNHERAYYEDKEIKKYINPIIFKKL